MIRAGATSFAAVAALFAAPSAMALDRGVSGGWLLAELDPSMMGPRPVSLDARPLSPSPGMGAPPPAEPRLPTEPSALRGAMPAPPRQREAWLFAQLESMSVGPALPEPDYGDPADGPAPDPAPTPPPAPAPRDPAQLPPTPPRIAEKAAPVDLNPYGRDIAMTAPLNFNKKTLGDVSILLTRDDRVLIATADFLRLIKPVMTEEGHAELAKALDGVKDFTPDVVAGLGIRIEYDPAQLSLEIRSIDPTKRAVQSLFQGGSPEKREQAPLPFSAYLNTNLIAQRRQSTGDITQPSVFLNGAVRYRQFVFEADVQGREDGFTKEYEVDRRYARFVFDEDEEYRRWYLGDLDPELRGRQGFVQMGGVGVSRKRQRFESFRSGVISGNRRLTLQESSTLRVTRNGLLVREFRLDPGQYDLRNLPLESGSNNVDIQIRNDAGQIQNVKYSAYLDSIELEPGDYEYGAYLGAVSTSVFGSPTYGDRIAFTGFYRKAFENRPAVGVGLQADETVQVVTGQTQIILRNGMRVRGDAAISNGDPGAGYAGALGLDYVVDRGKQIDAWTVNVDYTSEEFVTLGDVTGLNPTSWIINANWSRTFNEKLNANVGGSYNVSRSAFVGDSYSAYATTTYRFHRTWSAQVGLEYINYGLPTSGAGGRRDGFGVNLALVWQPRYDRRAEARYRSATNSGVVSFAQTPEERVGSIGYSVQASYDDGPTVISGQGDYIGNRFDATLSHAVLGRDINSLTDEQVTTLRIGSTIATTGRRFAIGRNVYDSFAIVYPHESLKDKQVITGDSFEGGRYRAKSGLLGPALANGLSSYVNQSVRYDVIDPPRGYDIGEGVLRVHPTYRSGYEIQVGSAAFVSAFGNLVDEGGAPLSLVSGRIRPADKPNADPELFFTNSVGRFAAQKLEPGKRYQVELFTNPPVTFVFAVPADSTGLLQLGKVAIPVPAKTK